MKNKYLYVVTLAKVIEIEEEERFDSESLMLGIYDSLTSAKCCVVGDLLVRAKDFANEHSEEDDLEGYDMLLNDFMDSKNTSYEEDSLKEDDLEENKSKRFLTHSYLDDGNEEQDWYVYCYSITKVTKNY